MKKVKTYHSPEIEAKGSDRMRSRIEIIMKGGQVISRDAETSRGTPERPMGIDGMAAKFTDCASDVLGSEQIKSALDAIYNIENQDDTNALVQSMTK